MLPPFPGTEHGQHSPSRRYDSAPDLPPLRATRLLDQVRERIRTLHYSPRTEDTYVHWCRAFIRFHDRRHPKDMGGPEVEAFLTHLAADRGLSISSHRQALSALLFLYSKVLGQALPWMQDIGRPVPKRRLPVVLDPNELAAVLNQLQGVHLLLAQLLYGTGMRITEGSAPSMPARARATRTEWSCCRCRWSLRCAGSWV
jgi:integrase